MKKHRTKLLGILILLIAFVGAFLLMATKPKAQRKKMASMIPFVVTTNVHAITTPIKVECLGTVIADENIALRAEVNGQVIATHTNLVEGTFVKKGDLLVKIDPRDYKLEVKQAEASLERARSELRLEEGQQAVAKHEMKLIGTEKETDPAYQDLMLREPQLKSTMASIQSAEAKLDSARLNLERTQIRAPFDAVVELVGIYSGDYAQKGAILMQLISTDRLFVRVSLPVGDLKYFPGIEKTQYGAEMTLTDGTHYPGKLHRLLPGLTKQGRMARMLIEVNDPYVSTNARPMLIGEVVRVEIFGMEAKDVFFIKRKHLRDGPTVWMMDENNLLRICPVKIVQGYTDGALTQLEVTPDWKLITSNIPAPVEGMKLRIMGETPLKRMKESRGRQ